MEPAAFSHETQPELLAPAGDWDCVRAAVANGADAVYFGLPKFNARLRAHNFTEEELPEVVAFCSWLQVQAALTRAALGEAESEPPGGAPRAAATPVAAGALASRTRRRQSR